MFLELAITALGPCSRKVMVSSEPTIVYGKVGWCLPVCTISHLSALSFVCQFAARAAVRTSSSSTQSFLFLTNLDNFTSSPNLSSHCSSTDPCTTPLRAFSVRTPIYSHLLFLLFQPIIYPCQQHPFHASFILKTFVKNLIKSNLGIHVVYILFGPLIPTCFLASSKNTKSSNFKWNHSAKSK